MTTFHLRAWNNATFRLTRNLSAWAATHDLASAVIRMQMRGEPADADPPLYEWATGATSGGQVAYDPTTKLVTITAPLADMRALGPGAYVYDCRIELADGSAALLFYGRLTFVEGVTRAPADVSSDVAGASGDTVVVSGEPSGAPGVLPVSLTAAITAIQALLGGFIGFGHGAPSSGLPAGERLYFDLDSATLYVRAPDGSWVAIAGGGGSGGAYVPSLDFSDANNSGYAALCFGAVGSGSPPPVTTPSLDFSQFANSGYLAALAA